MADEAPSDHDDVQSRDSSNANNKEGAGVLIRTIKAGDGVHFPKEGDMCRVHYEGWLEDGSKFDSSRARDQTFCFRLGKGQVIEGWDAAVARMSRGQVARVTIPSMYGYGEFGYEPIIPPRATLLFEIELIDFSDDL